MSAFAYLPAKCKHQRIQNRAGVSSVFTPMTTDDEHLRALAITHYVVGGISAVLSFVPTIYIGLGWMMLRSPGSFDQSSNNPPPPVVGWLFVALGAIFMLIGLAISICILVSANRLSRRQNYWFCFGVACMECAFFPFGTIVGVFRIVVLSRESVKTLFLGVRTPESTPAQNSHGLGT